MALRTQEKFYILLRGGGVDSVFSSHLFFFFLKFIYFERERETTSVGGAERESQTGCVPSVQCMGLELTN